MLNRYTSERPKTKIELNPYAMPSHLRSKLPFAEPARPTSPEMRTDSAQALSEDVSFRPQRISDALPQSHKVHVPPSYHADAGIHAAHLHVMDCARKMRTLEREDANGSPSELSHRLDNAHRLLKATWDAKRANS